MLVAGARVVLAVDVLTAGMAVGVVAGAMVVLGGAMVVTGGACTHLWVVNTRQPI